VLARLAAGAGLVVETLDCVADPTYLAFSPALYRVMAAVEDRRPAGRRIHLVGLLRRPAGSKGRSSR